MKQAESQIFQQAKTAKKMENKFYGAYVYTP